MSEVKQGELLVFSEEGFRRKQIVESDRKAFCPFEYAYFARPDTVFGGKPIYKVREEFGRRLARETDILEKADVIVSIPETADDAAYGLHDETGLPWERALRKHRYVTSRAFITPQERRGELLDKKFNVNWGRIKGKNVAVVEDSIVRGDTSMRTAKKMKEAGVESIHLYVTFPQIVSPCFYGIDMATYEELIGSGLTPEEVARKIGVESVNYQSIDSFIEAMGFERDEICLGCITGEYPTSLAQKMAEKLKPKA